MSPSRGYIFCINEEKNLFSSRLGSKIVRRLFLEEQPLFWLNDLNWLNVLDIQGQLVPEKKIRQGSLQFTHTHSFFSLNLQMPQNLIIIWLKYNCLHKTRKFYSVFRILETVSYASWFGIFLHCNSALIWLRTVLYN